MANNDQLLKRYLGCLFGLAVGDALGAPVEFEKRGDFIPVTGMRGGGHFDLRPGEWTDDTAMALCLAESLTLRKDFDPEHQMEIYKRWWLGGHLSSDPPPSGKGCFDIGITVRKALKEYSRCKVARRAESYDIEEEETGAGNGSLMRLAPIPLFYIGNPRQALELSARMSYTTHGAKAAADACRYFAGLIVGALMGVAKEELLSSLYCPTGSSWEVSPLCEEIQEVALGSFKKKNRDEVVGSGYVVNSLEAALWAFYSTNTFKDGVLAAVNLGDDADTTGAIYGQLAGAYYGFDSIPAEWVQQLARKDLIEKLATKIYRKKRA